MMSDKCACDFYFHAFHLGEYEIQQHKNQQDQELQDHIRHLMKNFCDKAIHKEVCMCVFVSDLMLCHHIVVRVT